MAPEMDGGSGSRTEVATVPAPSTLEVLTAVAPAGWPRERDAAHAAVAVLAFVGIPAVVAAATVLTLFVLAWAVLLAPLVAGALAWVAWRANRRAPGGVPRALR